MPTISRKYLYTPSSTPTPPTPTTTTPSHTTPTNTAPTKTTTALYSHLFPIWIRIHIDCKQLVRMWIFVVVVVVDIVIVAIIASVATAININFKKKRE